MVKFQSQNPNHFALSFRIFADAMSATYHELACPVVEMRACVWNDAVAARFDRPGVALSDDAVKRHLDWEIGQSLQRRIAWRQGAHGGEIHLAVKCFRCRGRGVGVLRYYIQNVGLQIQW